MKALFPLLSFLVVFAITCPELHAFGRGGGGGASRGGGRAAAPAKRAAPAPRRSPMTSSKIQRPTPRPAPKPVSRPAPRPAPKPAARPTPKPAVPSTRPATKPAVPSTRPATKPAVPSTRPATKPAVPSTRPATKPGGITRPGTKPSTLPGRPTTGGKPSVSRPSGNRPATLPGMVTYPNKPTGGNRPTTLPANRPGAGNRPGIGDRPGAGNRPGTGAGLPGAGNRPGTGNRPGIGNNSGNKVGNNSGNRQNNVHIDNVNVNRRNTGLNRPSTLPAANRNWNNNKWGGNSGVWGNNNNIQINNNFSRNNNFSYRPNYWGARPWWGAGASHGWHHGHWNYGWNSGYYNRHWYYRNDNFASGFMWGITVWSLGNLVYDMGYNSYRNPYPAPAVVYYPVPSSSGAAPAGDAKSSITYDQPLSVSAAAEPPGDEAQAELAETKSKEALEKSRNAFKQGDYMSAMKTVDEAIAYTPGDVTLHEYRALVFFALGRYADAAGVINPVLASGPGWGWDTMIDFYDSSSTYDAQLRKLEAYVKGTPEGADGHFLLGYHYLVCGHVDKAYEQFQKTTELQPADSIARQLRDLTKNSLPDNGTGAETTPEAPQPPPIPVDKLVGTWISDRGSDGKITFKMEESGDFTWSYTLGEETTELKGTYGLDEQGLLVLSMEDSQMVSVVTLPDDKDMKFMLVGSPNGDPGLDFKKS